jgi:hypothetical protein
VTFEHLDIFILASYIHVILLATGTHSF